MSHYPQQVTSLGRLFIGALKLYAKTLKAIFIIILLLAISKNVYSYFIVFPQPIVASYILAIILIALQLYLWSSAIYLTDGVMQERKINLSDGFRYGFNKLPSIYAAFCLLILVICAIFFISHWLATLASNSFDNTVRAKGIALLLFMGLPITYLIVMCFVIWPLIVLEQVSLWRSIKLGFVLVGSNWLRVFMIYILFLIQLYFLMPTTQHSKWIAQHYLNVPFDIIIMVIFTPVILNFMLLVLADLRQRARSEHQPV